MQDIIGNAITWLLIIIVLPLITYGNYLTVKKKVIYKNEKRHQSVTDNFYIIECGKPLKIIMWIALIFFLWLFLVNILTYFNICVLGTGIDLGTVIFFGIVLIFYLFVFSVVVMWRVIVDGNELIYRNYFGKTKRYTFDEIEEIRELKNKDIVVYSNGKKIFTVDHMLPTGVFLICTAKLNGIKVSLYDK